MIYTPFIHNESNDSQLKKLVPPVLGYRSKYINPEIIEEVPDDVISEENDINNSSEIIENKNDLPNSDRRGLFRDYYTQSGVDESRYSFFEKLAYKESGFSPTIQNSAGYPAWGYFQFMDGSYTDKSGKTREWDNIRKIANVDVTAFLSNPILQIQSANKLANKFLSNFSKKDLDKARELGYSDSALVAGAWLAGAGGVKKFLHKGENLSDVHGTNVKDRMDEFNNYFKHGGVIKFSDGGKEDVLEHLENNKDHIKSLYPILGNLPYNISRYKLDSAFEGFTDTIPAKGRYYPRANYVQISSNNNSPEEIDLVKYHEYVHVIDSLYKKKLERRLEASGGLTWDDGTKANLDLSELLAHLMTEVHKSGEDVKNMTLGERMKFIDSLKNKYTKVHHYTYKLGDGRFKHVTKDSNGKLDNMLDINDKVEDTTYFREYDDSLFPLAKVSVGDLLTALDVIYSPSKDVRKGQDGMKIIKYPELPEYDHKNWTISSNWHAPKLIEYINSKPNASNNVLGFNNTKDVYEYILSLPGSNPAIAAGWTGVFMKESSLNHNAISNKGATGIAQLLGSRLKEYKKWLGNNPDNWKNQISWIWEKINNGVDDWQQYYNELKRRSDNNIKLTDKEANDWRLMKNSKYVNYSFDNYRNVIQTLENPGDIAELMTWTFERPSNSEADLETRRKYAQEIYNTYNIE